MKVIAVLVLLLIPTALFVGVRAQLKPWENRMLPALISGLLVAVFLALSALSIWIGKTMPSGGMDDRYCEGSDCPPERPEQL